MTKRKKKEASTQRSATLVIEVWNYNDLDGLRVELQKNLDEDPRVPQGKTIQLQEEIAKLSQEEQKEYEGLSKDEYLFATSLGEMYVDEVTFDQGTDHPTYRWSSLTHFEDKDVRNEARFIELRYGFKRVSDRRH